MGEIANANSGKDEGSIHSRSGLGIIKAPFLAGLPHLLMGLMIGVGKLLPASESSPSPRSISVAGILLICLVAGVLCFAWRRGWPLWSASWYGYGTWIALAIIVFGIQSLKLEDDWRYTNPLFFVWLGVCVIGYLLILVRDRLRGHLAVAFLLPFLGILFLEFVPNPIEGWLAIGVGVSTALITGTITYLNVPSTGIKLLLGGYLAMGLSLAYVVEYQATDLPSLMHHHPTFTHFAVLLGLYWAVALGLLVGPILIGGICSTAVNRFQSIQ